MPRRLSTSGSLVALSLLFWTSTAASFALFDEIHSDARGLPLLQDQFGDLLLAPGTPTRHRTSLTFLTEDDLLAGPPLDLHREDALQHLVLAPDSLWPEGLAITAPSSAEAQAASAPAQRTTLPIPPTIALLGLGGMMILGVIRQGLVS